MKRINARRLVQYAAGRGGLYVPAGGWNGPTFIKSGHQLLVTLHRVATITQKKVGAELARDVKKLLRQQVHDVVTWARGPAKAAPDLEIALGEHDTLWAQAIREVFDEADQDITGIVFPKVQSVLGQAYSKTSLALGQEEAALAGEIASQARNLAGLVTRVNDTSRKWIADQVRNSIAQGQSVAETAAKLLEGAELMSSNRALTIARTEVNNAWQQGSVRAMQESETITHISVIGCQSREVELWDKPYYQEYLYRGESTCNIQDVPVNDADKLKFHVNHTGTIVPSQFRE